MAVAKRTRIIAKSAPKGAYGKAKKKAKQPPRPFALFVSSIFKGEGRTSQAERVQIMRDAGVRWKRLPECEKAKWRTEYSASCDRVRGCGVSQPSHLRREPRHEQTAVACPSAELSSIVIQQSQHIGNVSDSPRAHRVDPGVPRGILAKDMRDAQKGGSSSGGVRLGRFIVVDATRLGCGAYGSVVKVEDQHTRQLYAAKVFLNGEEDCRHELEVYSSLAGSGHEAFLSVLGSHANKAMSWLVLPWCPGSLSHHLRRAAPLGDEVLCGVANQVRAGVHHLHTLGWLHLDPKPANILYDSRTRHASICDFSISERYPLLHAVAQSRGTWCTEQYRPPELFRVPCAHYLSPQVDSWGLGCTVFEAGCGKRLFPEGDSPAMMAAMASVRTAGLYLRMRGSSPVCAAFASVMCRMEPAQRWKLAHPFPGVADMAARWAKAGKD